MALVATNIPTRNLSTAKVLSLKTQILLLLLLEMGEKKAQVLMPP